ncbi:M48 family metalloprotease [Anabaena sp. FACHB-1237]|uniref:zinc metalloprotease HtpX n=1 Tax=Anabaena sp. FACHB-1237 TaxID=2692769 RepID=UPI001681B207|nr:zinc metalloprotease HtpX [Anabaena sp. FACHB-1237]MBD2138784.1 M48 family metalloprotease [Anabaena sp. FACHB-1237]
MASHSESCLEAGLAALKQGNYQTAIANLEPIANNHHQSKACLQAKVGLVMAYARTGEIAKAISLCEALIVSSKPDVQEWAKNALKHLKERNKRPQKAPEGIQTNPDKYIKHNKDHENINSDDKDNTKTIKIHWIKARRAKVWQPLRKSNLILSRLLSIITFIALFWTVRIIFTSCLRLINMIIYQMPFVKAMQIFDQDPSFLILAILAILIIISPWLLDWLLEKYLDQEELTKEKLSCYSRETMRVMQRICQQKRWKTPKLKILPISTPMLLSYGNLPGTARITISQGLLEALADDEIATLYAFCLGQIGRWDFMLMSLLLLITWPFYAIYQKVSNWGNKQKQNIGKWIATFISRVSYSLWCILTGTALFNSRERIYYSDRQAAEITGNPNGLTRALLKISLGIAHDIHKQQHSCWQLETFNILAPVSYQQSMTLGSIPHHLAFENYLQWEKFQPHRQWFTINQTHPLLGDRLHRLNQIAENWHLNTEIHFHNPGLISSEPQTFLLQIAPWIGLPLGIVLAGVIWSIWQIGYILHIINLKWIYDNPSFILGCILIGFSIGTFIRINHLFPDIEPSKIHQDPQLPQLLADPSHLPIDSIGISVTGKLLGRHGINNSLAQDLILQTNHILLKLHHISWLGESCSIEEIIGKQVTVTGWLRRGATAWIDIQTLETPGGKKINSLHPVLSMIIAVASLVWGVYIMLKG